MDPAESQQDNNIVFLDQVIILFWASTSHPKFEKFDRTRGSDVEMLVIGDWCHVSVPLCCQHQHQQLKFIWIQYLHLFSHDKHKCKSQVGTLFRDSIIIYKYLLDFTLMWVSSSKGLSCHYCKHKLESRFNRISITQRIVLHAANIYWNVWNFPLPSNLCNMLKCFFSPLALGNFPCHSSYLFLCIYTNK